MAAPVGPRDHIQGQAAAAVTFVEYGDYECPYTRAAYPIVKDLQRRAGAQVRFVFRSFPLTTVHPHAQHAAEAAEAADAQGRFWEMYQSLFERQDLLTDDALFAYAESLDLDTTRFARELRQHIHAARVREDIAGGIESGVNGTPTFFINGVRHDAPYDLETLLRAVNAAARTGA
jgi:protein-disulfide isomerase